MLRLAADGIFAFSVAPLRLAGVTGLAATLLGVIYLLYVVAVLLSGGAAPGWASLVAVVVFMGGVQLTILWIMGEYVSRIAKQTRGRPSYFIAEKVPADNRNDAQRQPTSGEASQPAALFLDRRLR
jgi:dolichol-phosphate mannosyltransferase